MNKMLDPQKMIAGVSLIPESAPFDPEQRAWLNGFFAGMTGIEEMMAQAGSVGGANGIVVAEPEVEEDFPWHDDGLMIDERMELAEDRPYERKLMAAMAQLDCGSCGYECQTYAEAIANGSEANLTLCSPGGKETAKMVKKLVKLGGSSGGTTTAPAKAAATGVTRNNPFTAKLIKSEKLTGEASNKDVRHVEIDLTGSGINYEVGDSLGLYPTNCEELVAQVLSHCECDDEAAAKKRLLTYDLATVNEELCELVQSKATDSLEIERVTNLIDDDDQLDELDVLDFLQMFDSCSITVDQLINTLNELNPRLYSIASSLNAHPDQVHLTVGKVTYQKNDRLRKGVASTLLADRVSGGSPLNVFVQKSHGFTVPVDDSLPMIMVGPGTGIAPFLSFLQEREVRKASGKNWLFFGDQKSETDFLYQQQLEQWQADGVLNELDTAFSRDQEQKIYVQDRMREKSAQLFSWLETGGSFYVCGDASRMAKDVDKALHEIVEKEGKLSAAAAKEYVKNLKDTKRYCRDVY